MPTPMPNWIPETPFPAASEGLHTDGEWLWIPLRSEWRSVGSKPEEPVRQNFIRHLVDILGYDLSQMDQERRTTHGRQSPRADIVVWETADAKTQSRSPVLVVECKNESVNINRADFYQGESYTRAVGTEFFVATNRRYTGIFRLVPGLPGDFVPINEIPAARDWGNVGRIEDIKRRLRAFDRKEFQDLLSECHNILRDVHKMDPGRAFDTISKILFVKMYVERSGLVGTFTVDFLDRREATRMRNEPSVHEQLFLQTKAFFAADELFAENDRLTISAPTFRRIVKKLERFDLSKTSEDIKGIAFESFLGSTFRGELGQFFTPRPVVEFVVELLDPVEGQRICDPAAGSGGFLIKAFEHVRAAITADVQAAKDSERAAIEARQLSPDDEDAQVDAAFAALNLDLLPSADDGGPSDSRVGRLAWGCLFGCDAEARAARTAKMNMIMHGDGHGGIHYHDGLVDINGIFPGRFDLVMTNPPFGANVGSDQKVGATEETRVPNDPAYRMRCLERYGTAWETSQARMLQAEGTNILDLYEVGRGKTNRATEVLFVERCLELLTPGGRLGIVLPDGNLNNPSLGWLRRWTESRARILAVVSLPEATFKSSDATVKASVVFMQRFTAQDEVEWDDAWSDARAKHDAVFSEARDALVSAHAPQLTGANVPEVAAVLDELAALGVVRVAASWSAGEPSVLPRGPGRTKLSKAVWTGATAHRTIVAQKKKEYFRAFDQYAAESAARASRALRAEIREVDRRHNEELWRTAKELFNYPVFSAAPQSVGISTTGETGEGVPNDLPRTLEAYREFKAWLAGGARADTMPDFLRPPTV